MDKGRFLKWSINVVIALALLLHGWVTLKTSIGEYLRDAIFFVFVVSPYIIGAVFSAFLTRLAFLAGVIICLIMDVVTFYHVFIDSHNLFAEGYLITTPIFNALVIISVSLIFLLSERHFSDENIEQ